MALPDEQYTLIGAVRPKSPNTVIVNYSGSPVDLSNVYYLVAAIMQAWFPGQEAGYDIARVLTGKTNPCGRLSVKELKAFKKLFVEAKATETVIAELEKYTMSYYDIDADSWRAVKGKYHVLVGLSAGEVVGSTSFDAREDFLWKGL